MQNIKKRSSNNKFENGGNHMVKNDKNNVKLKKEVSFCLKEVYKCTFTFLF